MHLVLLSVGRPRDPQCIALHDRYAERIERLGTRYDRRIVRDAGGSLPAAAARAREGTLVLEELDRLEGEVVALDPGGTLLATEALAARLARSTARTTTFVLGGPLGLDPRVLERATWRWSLSPLTFPHELARVLVAEQLYRALTILGNHPYHK